MYYNSGFNRNVSTRPKFLSYQGIVTNISNFSEDGCSKLFQLQVQNRSVVNFVINTDTYFINHTKVSVGMAITVFYDADAPTILIYPPQLNAIVVAVNQQIQNIKVDRFGRNLLSQDKTLKLNVSSSTNVVLENGQSFDGTLEGRNLIVLYGASTKSIPAQTTPEKIIVMC